MCVESSCGAERWPLFAKLLDRFRSAVIRWNESRPLDPYEMGTIAHELNLSTAEFKALISKPSCAGEALSTRLSDAGLCEVELASSHGDVLRSLRRICSQCRHQERCMRDLRHGRHAASAKYCPNEQTLRALAREKRQSAAEIPSVPAVQS
jgi:hypothetical protein